MPNVIAALPNIGGASAQRHKVWLTPTTRVRCSNAAKTRNRLKLAGVPQTNEPISAASMKLPARELIQLCVSKFCLDEWQDIWDCCEGNKLHSIYPTVGSVKHSVTLSV